MADTKKPGSVRDLPHDVLDVAHRVWLAGLGALATAQDGSDRLFRQLVDRGREMEGEGREKARGAAESARAAAEGLRETARAAADSARERARGVGGTLDASVGTVLERLGVPSRSEIHELTRRIEELNAQVERLQRAPARPASTPKVGTKPAPSTTARPVPKTTAKPPARRGAKKAGAAASEKPGAGRATAGASTGKPPGGASTGRAAGGASPAATKKPGAGEGGA